MCLFRDMDCMDAAYKLHFSSINVKRKWRDDRSIHFFFSVQQTNEVNNVVVILY